MTDSCIFCKIVSKEAKATILYQDEQVTAFRDTHPVAPTHILIVPNRHIESVAALETEDEQLIGTSLHGGAQTCRSRKGLQREAIA